VIAVEEPILLLTAQGVAGRVEIADDPLQRRGPAPPAVAVL